MEKGIFHEVVLATPPNTSPSFKGQFMPSFLSPWNFSSNSDSSVCLFLAVGLQLPVDGDFVFVCSVTLPYQNVGR